MAVPAAGGLPRRWQAMGRGPGGAQRGRGGLPHLFLCVLAPVPAPASAAVAAAPVKKEELGGPQPCWGTRGVNGGLQGAIETRGAGGGEGGCWVFCLFACFSFFSPVGQRLALQAVEMAGGFPRRGFTRGCFPVVCTTSTSGWLPIDVGHDAGFRQHGADAGCDKLPPLLLPQPPSSSPPLHSQTPPIPETPGSPLLASPPRASPDPPPNSTHPLTSPPADCRGPAAPPAARTPWVGPGEAQGSLQLLRGTWCPPPPKKNTSLGV